MIMSKKHYISHYICLTTVFLKHTVKKISVEDYVFSNLVLNLMECKLLAVRWTPDWVKTPTGAMYTKGPTTRCLNIF